MKSSRHVIDNAPEEMVWDPQCKMSTVVMHSIQSKIPRVEVGDKTVGQLRGGYPYVRLFHFLKMQYSPNLYGWLMFILMYFKWLYYISRYVVLLTIFWKTHHHLLKNTPIWVWLLNVAVHESWVLSNKLMKDLGVWCIISTHGDDLHSPVPVKDFCETMMTHKCRGSQQSLRVVWP